MRFFFFTFYGLNAPYVYTIIVVVRKKKKIHEILSSILFFEGERKQKSTYYLYFTNIIIKIFTLFGVYGKNMCQRKEERKKKRR